MTRDNARSGWGGGGGSGAPLNSPAFTGTPTAPTAAAETNTTQLATTAFVLGNSLPVFNVKTYGAIGDGVTNDSVACQAAITACQAAGGGIVYFPVGTYLCSTAGLLVSSSTIGGVILMGSSAETSFVVVPQNAAYDAITISGNANVKYCAIMQLGIQMATGASGANTSKGIKITGQQLFTLIQDVNVLGFQTDVYFFNTVDVHCIRVFCQGLATTAVGYGFYIDGSSGQNSSINFRDCNAFLGTTATSYGYYQTGVWIADLFMFGCEADGCTYGLFIDGTSATGTGKAIDMHVQNLITDSTSYGIYVQNLSATAALDLDSCYNASGSGIAGITIASCTGVTIRGFQAVGSVTGIVFSGTSTRCSVTGSVFGGLGLTTGISVAAGCSNIIISDNVFETNVTTPIVVTAGATGILASNNVPLAQVVTAPAVTSGAAFTPSTVADTMVYLTYALAGTVSSVTMGPTTGAENAVYGTSVVAVGGGTQSLRVPAGWKVIVTTVTSTATASVVTC